jgi:hypothetical protein
MICGRHGEKKPLAYRVWVGRLKERDHFEDLHVAGRIVLK